MTTSPNPRPQPDADLDRALYGPCQPDVPTSPGWYDPIPEAVRCLRLLDDALQQMPNPNDGPAQRHLDWAHTSRQRARQAQIVLPHDRTAPTAPPRARVAFGLSFRRTGDDLLDTLMPDQTRLVALRDDLHGMLSSLGCEDARDTATTVRNVDRCLTTYITEIELGDAGDYLHQTVDNPYGPDITHEQLLAFHATRSANSAHTADTGDIAGPGSTHERGPERPDDEPSPD